MSLSLAVVTHTCRAWGRDIRPCLESVKAALPDKAQHVVIALGEDNDAFIKARYEALALAEVVAFVDDDDTVEPDALRLGLAALAQSGAGVAFTNEVKTFADGSEIRHHKAGCTYEMATDSQGIIHHLALIRTAAVSGLSFGLASRYGVDSEWVMKTEAALLHGAVHVPMFGYRWTQHAHQHHCLSDQVEKRTHSREKISAAMRLWGGNRGVIPVYGG
ncbi:glycosyltransferase family 2 protein [Methylovulum psychrotolerans]|uniref:glycosyltransferase family A protein n=1 Tax=Methylovulum psychrotolerans TaxID=1704499 RepID=UPI001BFFB593|nr:glycosyltransferase family A protein [Methylovulum psychrotolerans]MBT9097479.1 glycosyltransferase family 2 protein [Methylovulum psychrotolerans]